jgi:predicted nucleic acid-binding protein
VLVDCLIAAHAERQGSKVVLSFDAAFDKILGISRREP